MIGGLELVNTQSELRTKGAMAPDYITSPQELDFAVQIYLLWPSRSKCIPTALYTILENGHCSFVDICSYVFLQHSVPSYFYYHHQKISSINVLTYLFLPPQVQPNIHAA